MRSLVLSLVLLAGVSTHAVAQRPSITRPIQKAREAAAKSSARTATAEAAGQEPAVRRDSVPVTAAAVVTATKPGTTPANGAAPAAKPAAPAPSGKAAAPNSAPSTGTPSAAPTTGKAPVSKAADSARSPVTQPGSKAPATKAAPTTAATSDKSDKPVPPAQAGTRPTAPAGTKAPTAAAAAAAADAKVGAPSRADSSATTVSVGSSAPARGELRIDREVFTYDAGGRRDPFVSLLSTSDLRPLFSDLLLVVINYDPQRRNSVAIMRDATTKEQYRVRQGQLIGRMRVAAIEQKRVLFTIDEFGFSRQESLVIGDTTKVRKQ